MKKWKLVLGSGVVTLLVPVSAFAWHASNCCGDWLCCLRHLGCC